MSDYTPTRVGQLLLDPSGPYIWTVKSKKVLVRASGGFDAQATLTKPFVPLDWKIIDSDGLARTLLNGDRHQTLKDLSSLLSDPLQGAKS